MYIVSWIQYMYVLIKELVMFDSPFMNILFLRLYVYRSLNENV